MNQLNKMLFIIAIITIIYGCNSTNSSDADQIGVVEINVAEAVSNERDFRLSDLIDEIELIEFESTPESYFINPRSYQITQSYILIACDYQNIVLLFKRNGDFIRKIGRQGKGPGEYVSPWFVSIDPDQENIIIVDISQKRLIKYSVDGQFQGQKEYQDANKQIIQTNPVFLDNQHFAVAVARPKKPVDNFHSIYIYDIDLNLSKKLLPRPNNDELCLYGLSHKSLSNDNGGPYFWETVTDTLYSVKSVNEVEPLYHYNLTRNKETVLAMTDPFSWEEETYMTFIGGVTNAPRYLIAWAILETPCLIVYDKNKRESFSVIDPFQCDLEQNGGGDANVIDNDLFGFEPIRIHKYHPKEESYSDWFLFESVELYNNLDCVSGRAVKNPQLRDLLVDKVKNFKGDELPILVLMHSKQ